MTQLDEQTEHIAAAMLLHMYGGKTYMMPENDPVKMLRGDPKYIMCAEAIRLAEVMVAALPVHDAYVAAHALESAAQEWAADPDAWGDNDKDYRNELRDRAAALRKEPTA